MTTTGLTEREMDLQNIVIHHRKNAPQALFYTMNKEFSSFIEKLENIEPQNLPDPRKTVASVSVPSIRKVEFFDDRKFAELTHRLEELEKAQKAMEMMRSGS